MTRANVLELAFIGGLAAIVRGVHLIYEPAAWIIGGLILSGCALMAELNRKVKDEAIPDGGGSVPVSDSANPQA